MTKEFVSLSRSQLALIITADPKEFGGRSAGESTSSDKSSRCQGIGRSIGESVIRVPDRMKVIGLQGSQSACA